MNFSHQRTAGMNRQTYCTLTSPSSLNTDIAIPTRVIYFRYGRDLRAAKDLTMPILENPRHEAFARELAKDKSAPEAYEIAGFRIGKTRIGWRQKTAL
jgi:phage terminase small subunit